MDLFDNQAGFEKPAGILRDDVRFIFEHWKKVMKKNNKVTLDKKRTIKLIEAVKLYGDIQFLCRAVDGILLDPFYNGQNERKAKYLDIIHIFKNAKNIEHFEELARRNASKNREIQKLKEGLDENPWEKSGITWEQWYQVTYNRAAPTKQELEATAKKFKIDKFLKKEIENEECAV